MTTFSTKAKRAAGLRRLEAIAEAYGATMRANHYGRTICVTLERDGVSVMTYLDGESRSQAHLGHWCSERRLCHTFGADVRGDVNRYHGCKATTYTLTFDELLHCIERGFEVVRQGVAFAEAEA